MPASALDVATRSVLPDQSMAQRVASHAPSIDRNVGPTGRLASTGMGGMLIMTGLTGRHVDPLQLAIGGYLLYRGLSGNCPLSQAANGLLHQEHESASVMPARTGARIEHVVTINRPPADLYREWRNLSQLPGIMSHLVEVREGAGGKSHWVARGPMGIQVAWDAELIADQPNEVISWRSLPGSDVDTAGSVHFRPGPTARSTELRVNLKYDPPATAICGSDLHLYNGFIPTMKGRHPRPRVHGRGRRVGPMVAT
jgi:uncharacterized membrane protein